MRWTIRIDETGLDPRNLSDLVEELGFEVIQFEDSPALTSSSIDACATAKEAFEEAHAVRDAFVVANIDPKFRLGVVTDLSHEPPARHHIFGLVGVECRVTTGTGNLTVQPPVGLDVQELAEWHAEREEREYQTKLRGQRIPVKAAFRSERATKALRLLQVPEPTGAELYKLYELAEGAPQNRRDFHCQFQISKQEFDRFSDAVHNQTVSGDWARHAYDKEPRTPNPMSKAEAKVFVHRIVWAWLESVADEDVE